MAKLFTLLVLKAFFVQIHCVFEQTPVLQIPQGRLTGLITNRGNMRQYLGIPYGSVDERFQEAGPPPRWLGVFNATDSSIMCPQSLERLALPLGVEDCLILNVYTPGQASSKRLYPVMVFIHGGGYQTGSGSNLLYHPQFLVAKGVIVVTLNYRLGAFGFLCLGINGAPGNIGLKDQIAALKWVQDNIKYFGGNPDAVTIFGESAGSSSVSYLILSPATKGLYKRAIMESGTALSPFAFSRDPIEKASMVAARLGYKTKNPHELLKIFKNATKNEIIIATESTVSDNLIYKFIFRPCAEKQSIGTKPFLTMSPQEMLNSGTYNKVPMIIGYNNKEGIFFANFNKQQYQHLNKNFGDILPENLYFSNKQDKKRIADQVRYFYFGNRTINEDCVEGLIDLISDTLIHYPSVSMTEYFLKHSHMPIYNYYFKYDSYRNLAKILVELEGLRRQKGATHGDELFYLFQPIIFWPLPLVGEDRTVVDRMTSMWTNFAKFGNPTAIKSAALTVDWAASDETELRYLNIDKNLTMGPLPNPERIELWRNIYESNIRV